MTEHFGVKLTSKKDLKLNRDNFALINTKPSLPLFKSLAEKNAYTDESGLSYREDWCNEYRKLCLKNFDLNMKYFSMLDRNRFNNILESYLTIYDVFEEVFDLNKYAKVEGFYIMILDEYKQVYIGKTEDIKKRIMQHWSKTMPFDRILLPMYAYDKSCFSINFFRALDTTRIFAWKNRISNGIEEELIRNFPARFCTNRIGGDISDSIKAVSTMNLRHL